MTDLELALAEVDIENACSRIGLDARQRAVVIADHRALGPSLLLNTLQAVAAIGSVFGGNVYQMEPTDPRRKESVDTSFLIYVDMLAQVRKYAQILAASHQANPPALT